jgi:hypothetical protein
MEQRIFVKLSTDDRLPAIEIHRKLVERYGDEALSYPAVTYWRRQLALGRRDLKDTWSL